jgi:hypothetical protein
MMIHFTKGTHRKTGKRRPVAQTGPTMKNERGHGLSKRHQQCGGYSKA